MLTSLLTTATSIHLLIKTVFFKILCSYLFFSIDVTHLFGSADNERLTVGSGAVRTDPDAITTQTLRSP